jgi:hypothetical protein
MSDLTNLSDDDIATELAARGISSPLPLKHPKSAITCSRCGSPNVKTFEMAYASHGGGDSRESYLKFIAFGPLSLFIRSTQNSVIERTSPPEKPIPAWAFLFALLFLVTFAWLVTDYLSRGFDYRETWIALWVTAIAFIVASGVVIWDLARFNRAKKQYPQLLDRWSRSWICLQCGTTREIP